MAANICSVSRPLPFSSISYPRPPQNTKPPISLSPCVSKTNRDSRHRVQTPGIPTSRKRTQKLNSEVSPHRAVSVVRLLRIEHGGAFADLLNMKGRNLREHEMDYVERTLGFRTRDLDDRDIRLVTDVVGGSIRWRRYLDYLIMSLCHKEQTFRDMEPILLQVLRVGFYELIKLGMPPYAVVHECVRLAKAILRPGAGNIVNAIMRKLVLLKEKDSLPLPKVEGDSRTQARALSIIYSHPVWMVRRWIRLFGHDDAVRLMNWNNTEPKFSLRANHAKGYTRDHLINQLSTLKVPYEESAYLDDFIRIQRGMQVVLRSELLKEGLCAVQDEGAGLVVAVVNPQPGEIIIDCCAAPGGKSLYIASRLRGEGMVLAVDVNKSRLGVLKETAKLHNVDAVISTIHSDIRLYAKNNNMVADKVLLDAPCSGLGVLSKRADLRWNRSLENMNQLKNLQDELLDACSLLVKPGGILIYSTCSIDPEENEDRIIVFLQRHPEFVLAPVDGYVPRGFVTDKGFYSSSPLKHSLDGAFAARLTRIKEKGEYPARNLKAASSNQ